MRFSSLVYRGACLSTAALLVMCTSTSPDEGGVMLEIVSDGTLSVARLKVEVRRADDSRALEKTYENPPLPNTIGIANTSAGARAALSIASFDAKNAPTDRRDFELTNIPADRVVGLRVVLSAACGGRLRTDGSSTCTQGMTCDPDRGAACVTSSIDASGLASYVPGDETKPAGQHPFDAGGMLPEASPPPDTGMPLSCTATQKRCGDTCVGIDDPTFGCSKDACTSCGDGSFLCIDGACAPACTADQKRCNGVCVSIDDPGFGCSLTKCSPSDCPDPGTGTLKCTDTHECLIGACGTGTKKCGSACQPVDAQHGCEGSDCTACTSTGTASGVCSAGACSLACKTGFKKCGTDCVSVDDPNFGCGPTSCDSTACPSAAGGQLICSSGTCIVGTCGAGTKDCDGKCVPFDPTHGCTEQGRCTACASNETCAGPTLTCQCVPESQAKTCTPVECGSTKNNCSLNVDCGTVCQTPPKAFCSDASTLMTYAATGTCNAPANKCNYTATPTTCPFGCSAGACKPECDTAKPYGTATLVQGGVNVLTTNNYHSESFLLADELTMYFSRATVSVDVGVLYVAKRATKTDPFGTATKIHTTPGDGEEGGWVSADELTHFYSCRNCNKGNGIFTGTRASKGVLWSGPEGTDPPFLSTKVAGSPSPRLKRPFLVGNDFYFDGNYNNDTAGGDDIYVMKKSGSSYGTPTPVPIINGASDEHHPVLSADGLTIYFESSRAGGKGDRDIWRATRATPGSNFGTPSPVSELNTTLGEWPGWVTANDCRLYFTRQSTSPAGFFIYVAQRPQ